MALRISFSEVARAEEQLRKIKRLKYPDPLVMNIFHSGEEIPARKSESEMRLYIQSKEETFGH